MCSSVATAWDAHTTAAILEREVHTFQRVTICWIPGKSGAAAWKAVQGMPPGRPPPQEKTSPTSTDSEEEKTMEENKCKECVYRQYERVMSRKEEAFDMVSEKMGRYAALADCVADAVEGIEIVTDDDRNYKKYEKLLELAYLLSESLEYAVDCMA